MPLTDEDARRAALEFADAVHALCQERLDAGLLGFYLIGSLAHGGFNRRYSDIDLAVVAENEIDQTTLDDMRTRAAARSPELAAKLSLFWADRNFSGGRFPPLDRIDFLDHAVALSECERARPPRPSHGEIHDYLRGAPFENWRDAVRGFATLDVLAPEDHKPYLRAHLYPARFVYSWMTGEIASNDDADDYLRRRAPAGLDMDLIERALECRLDAADPDALFPDRAALPSQVDACARLMAGDDRP